MKNRIIILCALVLSVCNVLQANEFEQLMKRIRQDFAKNPSAELIESELKIFSEADSLFTDVDYASIRRTIWPPIAHVERLSDFAFAYTNPENKYYQSEKLYNCIIKGLAFWHNRNPWCHNWWFNEIDEPQKLGVLLIQMRTGKKQVPAELEKKMLQRIKEDGNDPAKKTGANRTDIALHWIYRSCLSQNEEDLQHALNNIYNPIVYTTKEGFQYDNCYFQHGQQLYIGGYGDEILKGITQVASYVHGTRFSIPQDKLEILSKFMRETYYTSIRGKHMLFDVLGRSISRPHILDKSYTKLFAQRMIELDPEHAEEFKNIVARLEGKQPAHFAVKAKHTHYFRGDYSQHVRPHYTFDVRLASTRTSRCEYGNNENLKTYFLSDGCTNIVTSGEEYYDIFPTWNWARIPGITAPQKKEIPMAPKAWGTLGSSTFAGGVSDSLYGVTAYAYMDTCQKVLTGAKKAWFFFDDEIVCLGADIHSAAEEDVNTTLNQCISPKEAEALVSLRGKQTSINEGNYTYSAPDWVIHNGIAYLFPYKQEVFVDRQDQHGTWYNINRARIKDPQTKRVFTVGINHGKQPKDATYAYLVVPGKNNAQEIAAYQKKKNVEILANTSKMQVVRHKELGICGLAFYEPGTFSHKGLTVTVSKPCVLMIKDTGKRTASLHIADPAQAQAAIQVTVKMSGKSKKSQTVDCNFQGTGIYAGATKAFNLMF